MFTVEETGGASFSVKEKIRLTKFFLNPIFKLKPKPFTVTFLNPKDK